MVMKNNKLVSSEENFAPDVTSVCALSTIHLELLKTTFRVIA